MTKALSSADRDREPENQDRDRPLFMISVVSRMVAVHPQTLRFYERLGLVGPQRSRGKKRLYSLRDVEHLQYIQNLTRDRGVNLSGVKMILELRKELDQIRRELHDAMEVLKDRYLESAPSTGGPKNPTGRRNIKIRIERG